MILNYKLVFTFTYLFFLILSMRVTLSFNCEDMLLLQNMVI